MLFEVWYCFEVSSLLGTLQELSDNKVQAMSEAFSPEIKLFD
jgi:hypothetical protein